MKTPSKVRKLEVGRTNLYKKGKNPNCLAFSRPDWFLPYVYKVVELFGGGSVINGATLFIYR